MFTLLKMQKLNKITETHSEKISDYLILMNIVSTKAAKDNLSSEQFDVYYNTFKELSKRKQEIPTNSLQYQHRAFGLIYEIEFKTGIQYPDICGYATDILYMYRNIKPKFEELVEDIVASYLSTIDSIGVANDEKEKLCCLSIAYFGILTTTLINNSERMKENYLTKYTFSTSFKRIMAALCNNNGFDSLPSSYAKYYKDINEMNRIALNNTNDIDEYINRITDTFLSILNNSQNIFIAARLVSLAKDWKDY